MIEINLTSEEQEQLRAVAVKLEDITGSLVAPHMFEEDISGKTVEDLLKASIMFQSQLLFAITDVLQGKATTFSKLSFEVGAGRPALDILLDKLTTSETLISTLHDHWSKNVKFIHTSTKELQ